MTTYDRTVEDIGNVVCLEHVNTRVPDQRLATLFYVMGLGLTRDPYLVTGVANMWINLGRSQFHRPRQSALPKQRSSYRLRVLQFYALLNPLDVTGGALKRRRPGLTSKNTPGTQITWRSRAARKKAMPSVRLGGRSRNETKA